MFLQSFTFVIWTFDMLALLVAPSALAPSSRPAVSSRRVALGEASRFALGAAALAHEVEQQVMVASAGKAKRRSLAETEQGQDHQSSSQHFVP